MTYLKPNLSRSKIAITLVLIVMALDIIGAISTAFEYDLIQRAAEGLVTTEEANANDHRQQLIGIAYLIVYITSAVTFIQWFRRAYFNLGMVFGKLDHDEGWAAGAWFVPIIGLYLPYKIMKELYRKTAAIINERMTSASVNFTLIGIWWTFWIVANIIGQISFRYALRAESIDELSTSSVISIVSDLIGIPLALITVKLIRDYSKMETILQEVNFEEDPVEDRPLQTLVVE